MQQRQIEITASSCQVTALLNNSKSADLLWLALPITGIANIWGSEIYFGIDLETEPDDARDVVDFGDVAYWPPGKALCLFFGPTPTSQKNDVSPATPVNLVGKIKGDPPLLKQVRPGDNMVVRDFR